MSYARAVVTTCIILLLGGLLATAAQPNITNVSIPDVSMKIGDAVTVTITVQSDAATYTLNASNIGGYALSGLSKQSDTTYTAQFTVTSGGNDYAAGDDIPTSVELEDGGLTDTWSTPISQSNDLLDANAPIVNLTAPVGGEFLAGNSSITWNTTEANPSMVLLELSADGGGTYPTTLDASAPDTGTYSWDTTGHSDGTLYRIRVTATDQAGNSSSAVTSASNFTIDNTAPTDPTPSSSSHTVSVWDDDNTVDIQISGASDDDSGVDGFEIEWNQSATWTPTETKEQEETWSGATFTATSNGDWYFHIATVDNAGNWTSTEHLGPFQIDTTDPTVPSNQSPADGTRTTDTSPTLSWDASTDADSGIDNYRIQVDGPATRDTYVSDTDYTPSLGLDGTYTWRVYARDNAGNSSAYTADRTFIIDTTGPTINDLVVNDTLISESDTPGDGTLEIEIQCSEAMDETVTPTLVFDPTVASTLTWDSGYWDDATTYLAYFDVSDGDVEEDTVTIDITGLRDLVGNEQQDMSPWFYIEIDTIKPSVTDVSIDTDPVYDGDLTQVVTVTFNETMLDNGTADPSISFGSGSWTSNADGAYNGADTIWTETFTLTDNNQDVPNVTVDVSGAKDAIGNDQENYAAQAEFDIDTLNPTVTSIVRADANPTNAASIDFTVTFSESVSGVATGNFSLDSTCGCETIDSVNGSGTTWTVTVLTTDNEDYDVSIDLDSDLSSITDDVGNELLNAYTAGEEYEVDRLDPDITQVWISRDGETLDDDLVGEELSVYISLNDDINQSATPSISFSSDVSGTLTFDRVSWGASSCTVYYAIGDGNEEIQDITVSSITNVEDDVGNPVDYIDYGTDEFDIDNENPTVSSVSFSPPLIDDLDAGSSMFHIDISFSEEMDDFYDPTVTFSPAVDSTLTLNPPENWSFGSVEVWYDVADAGVDEDEVRITVTGCRDMHGNLMETYSDPDPANDWFEIDMENPTVTSVSVDDTLLSDSDAGTTLTVTVDFSEDMTDDGSEDPSLTFSPAVGSTLAFSSDSWPSATRYQAVYDISDAGIDENSVTIDVEGAKDANGNDQEDYTPEHEFEIDTLNPVVSTLTLSDDEITDADVGDTFTVTVDYSEDMIAGTIPSIVFSPNLDTTLQVDAANTGWTADDIYVFAYTILDGNVTVLDDDITITNAQDLAGNVQVIYNYDDQLDVDTENPYFHDFTVTGGAVDTNCLRTVEFTAKVTDPNGTMAPSDITVNQPTVTNASIGAVYDLVKEFADPADNPTTITITGKVDVTALTGCPVRVTVSMDAVDSVGNDTTVASQATEQEQSDDVVDNLPPTVTIDFLRPVDPTPFDGKVDSCCQEIMEYQVTVQDNCCVDPANIQIEVTATNAQIGIGTLIVNKTPAVWEAGPGQNEVIVTGTYVVQCVTECPASTELTATLNRDCCGGDPNGAAIVDALSYDSITDDIPPIPRDDPRQDMVMDESAIDDENLLLKVRLDEFGTYRLVLRENTPVRLDVLVNDADNCSRCCNEHSFDACVSCSIVETPCQDCCAELRIAEIVQQPTFGTAEIIDEMGDCSGGSQIRFAPDRGYLGPDFFTYRIADACGNVSDVIATVYLQTVPEVWVEDIFVVACADETTAFSLPVSDLFIDIEDPSRIPFEFEILAGPSHGVVTGSLQNVDYAPPSTVTDPQFGVQVPSLDFTETAILNMSYTPADGFVGRDLIRIQISDPFGGSAIAVVDFAVGACGPGGASGVVLQLAGDQILPMLLPGPVGEALMAESRGVLLRVAETGTLYPEALTIGWDEEARAYVLTVDGSKLPYDIYELVIPLDGGEVVTLRLEVGEAE